MSGYFCGRLNTALSMVMVSVAFCEAVVSGCFRSRLKTAALAVGFRRWLRPSLRGCAAPSYICVLGHGPESVSQSDQDWKPRSQLHGTDTLSMVMVSVGFL